MLDHLLGLKFQTIYADSPQDSGLWRNLVMIKGETSRRKESGIALYSCSIVQRRYVSLACNFTSIRY